MIAVYLFALCLWLCLCRRFLALSFFVFARDEYVPLPPGFLFTGYRSSVGWTVSILNLDWLSGAPGFSDILERGVVVGTEERSDAAGRWLVN